MDKRIQGLTEHLIRLNGRNVGVDYLADMVNNSLNYVYPDEFNLNSEDIRKDVELILNGEPQVVE